MLQFFPTVEGYVDAANESNSGIPFEYVYNYTDHLDKRVQSMALGEVCERSSVRVSYRVNSKGILERLQENDYYPFGMKHQKSSSQKNFLFTKNNYKYNGKEFQDELNLNLYDYSARNYDPVIGRWFNIDPLAPKYFTNSPYNYTMNNPVYFIDPDGMQSIRNNENGSFDSPDDDDDLYGTVSGVTVYGRSGGFDLSGLWFLQNSGRYNKYSFTNTAVRSYQNMMSTENGKTYYNNLHNSKLSKQMDNVALGYMGLLALPMASAVVLEYGSMAIASEIELITLYGNTDLKSVMASTSGQILMKTTIDMAAQELTTGKINGVAALTGAVVPGNSVSSVIKSGMMSEGTDLLMKEAIRPGTVTADTIIVSGVKAAVGGPSGALGSSFIRNSTASDAVGAVISNHVNNKNEIK